MRIVVAMSGGVDSSTAAALLVEQGHDVIGLAMKTHATASACSSRACCTPDDMRDARRVADALGIPFYLLSYEELFEREVVMPFVQAYARGETPNPCIECNDKVKFRPLLKRARLLGAEQVATGHYARIEGASDAWRLHRGVDRHKDQSYFLYRLTQEQLGQLSFPLGGMHKDEVREHARRFGLPVSDKRESQEICFVGAEGYAAVVDRLLEERPQAGNIVTTSGKVVGRHAGVHHFTIGQRRGLGIAAPEPLYVTGIDAERAEVRVGTHEELLGVEVQVGNVHWVGEPCWNDEVLVQQRYREAPRPARLEPHGDGARVRFLEAHVVGAPGQAVVFYRGDELVGGGTLRRVRAEGQGMASA